MWSLLKVSSPSALVLGHAAPVSSRCLSKVCFKYRPIGKKGATKPNPKKLKIGKEVVDIFERSGMVAVFHYNNLNTQEWNRLRLDLTKNDVKMKVIPSKVSTRALEHTKYGNISLLFRGCTAVAYGDDTKVSALLSTTKSEQKLHLLGGVVANNLLTARGLQDYAKLPSPLALHHQLLATLLQAQVAMGNTLQAVPLRLAGMLGQVADGGTSSTAS